MSDQLPKLIFNWGIAIVLVTFNLVGIVQSAFFNPLGFTTQLHPEAQANHAYDQALITFLSSEGETRGYTNFWVAYTLDFLTQERMIYLAALPYHWTLPYDPRDDRYPPYRQEVSSSTHVAYITISQPDLQEEIRSGFTRLNMSWKEKQIGDYFVFYHLSKPVAPKELNLGVTLE